MGQKIPSTHQILLNRNGYSNKFGDGPLANLSNAGVNILIEFERLKENNGIGPTVLPLPVVAGFGIRLLDGCLKGDRQRYAEMNNDIYKLAVSVRRHQ